MEITLDEDYFAREQMNLTISKRKLIGKKYIYIQILIRKKLLCENKISKTTFNRWAKVMSKIYGYMVHEIMMPNEFNEKLGAKSTSIKYFRNAEMKIAKELKNINIDYVDLMSSLKDGATQ